ncbi:MAG: histidine kinase [Clostridiaceae bacterium]|nr:histidine kinase [Clostridiaceae bacterium]
MKQRRFAQLSISLQLRIFVAAIVAAICAVFIAAYFTIAASLTEQNILYTSQTLTQMKDSIEEKTDTLEGILQSVGYDKNVALYLYHTDQAQRYDAYTQITSQVGRLSVFIRHIRFFFVMGNNGVDYFSSGRRSYYNEVFQNLPKNADYYYEFLDGSGSDQKEIMHTFVVTSPLYDLWGATKTYDLGVIAMVVDRDYLAITDFEGAYGMGIYLIDRDSVVRSQNISNAIPEGIVDTIISSLTWKTEGGGEEYRIGKETYIAHYTYLEPIEGYLLSVTPKSAIQNEVSWLRTIVAWMLACLAVVMLFMFRLMRNALTVPLHRFAALLRAFRSASSDRIIKLSGCAEIEEISAEFNRMLERENALTGQLVLAQEKLYKTELLKKQTELSWLRSQLNPHFLYNTLEASIGLAYTENAQRTAETLKSLSLILRYSVKGEERVPLRRELEIIRAYLSIQGTRFSGAFEVIYDFSDEVLELPLPKMILQPIVENAVVHGLEPKGAGHLYISGEMPDDSHVRLCVEDDGIGMDLEMLERVRVTLNMGAGAGGEGIGVANIADRLRLLCGNVTFHVDAAPDRGCKITIEIPVEK